MAGPLGLRTTKIFIILVTYSSLFCFNRYADYLVLDNLVPDDSVRGLFGAGLFGAADDLVQGLFGAGTIWCRTIWCRTIWCRGQFGAGQFGAGLFGVTDYLVSHNLVTHIYSN